MFEVNTIFLSISQTMHCSLSFHKEFIQHNRNNVLHNTKSFLFTLGKKYLNQNDVEFDLSIGHALVLFQFFLIIHKICTVDDVRPPLRTPSKFKYISIYAEPETIANAFNSYFNSIPITLSDNNNNNLTAFESYLDDQIPESDNFHQTSIHEITKIIKHFKNINSVGWVTSQLTYLKQMS